MANPLTKEQIDKAKQEQRAIITECDKAVADLQRNIGVLNNLVVQQNSKKKLAQNTFKDMEEDFPMLASLTTALGNTDATSIIDSALIGSDVLLVGKTLKIRPSDLQEDSAAIVEFKKDKGEIVVSKALKGGQVTKGVPFKVLEIIPSSEVM